MLKRRYSISGKVFKSSGIGKKIGFPTINIPAANHQVLPKQGIFSSLVKIENKIHPGVTYIGTRPTFDFKNKVIETFILGGFNRNIYNKQVTIYFLKKIRDEKKFSTVELLKKNIYNDTIKTMKNSKKMCKMGILPDLCCQPLAGGRYSGRQFGRNNVFKKGI